MSDMNSEKLSLAAGVQKFFSNVKNIVNRMFKKNLTEDEMDRLRYLNDECKPHNVDPDVVVSEELRKAMDDSNKVRHQLW